MLILAPCLHVVSSLQRSFCLLLQDCHVYLSRSQYDSDGDEIVGSDNEDDEYTGYKVWYSVSCDIAPAPAERSISIKCNCQVSIAVTNLFELV